MNTEPAVSSPVSSPARRWLPLVALALVTLVALGLRLWQIDESLWLDELHTSWVVIDGPGPIAQRAAWGNTSPAYFYLVWAVTTVLGHTEFSLRLLSLVAGVGLVPLLYYVVTKATGQPAAGLFAAALAALDPNGLFYSIEARCYALVELVSVVQVWLFWQLLSKKQGSTPVETSRWRDRLPLRLGFIATSLLLFYLHYTTQLLLAAEVIAYVLLCARAERLFGWLRLGVASEQQPGGPFAQVGYRPLQFLLDLGIVLAAESVTLPSLLAIYERRENWKSFVWPQPWQGIFTLLPLVIYLLTPLAAVGVGYAVVLLWRKPAAAETTPALKLSAGLVLLALCWLFVPLVAAWYATQYELAAIFLRRYLMASIAAPLVLAGLFYAATPSRLARAGCWIAAIAFLLGGDGVITTGVARQYQRDSRFVMHSNEDWRGAVGWLNQQMHGVEGDVYLQPGVVEEQQFNFEDATPEQREYLSFPVRGIYRLEAPVWGVEGFDSIVQYGLKRGHISTKEVAFPERCQLPSERGSLEDINPETSVWRFYGLSVYRQVNKNYYLGEMGGPLLYEAD